MSTGAGESLDTLRNRCLDYVLEQRDELDPLGKGVLEAVTPGGLEIEVGPGYMNIRQLFEEPSGDVELAVEYRYGYPNSPFVRRYYETGPKTGRSETLNASKHRQAAALLLKFFDSEEAAA